MLGCEIIQGKLPNDNDAQAWLNLLKIEPCEELLIKISEFLRQYLIKNSLSSYILGLSGGIDSSFLAALLFWQKIPFRAYTLTIEGNKKDEIARAQAVLNAYCDTNSQSEGSEFELTHLYKNIAQNFCSIFGQNNSLANGNIKARLRMIFLYHAAQLHKGCVLGTDQLDELLTGFWTLHGDVGDIAPIQLIPKTVEYGLAKILSTKLEIKEPLLAAIEAIPTDGLGFSISDLEQLQADSYQEVENLFRRYFDLINKPLDKDTKIELENLKKHTVIARFLSSKFKRYGSVIFDPLG